MAGKKIQATKNYRMFTRSEDNRDTDMKKHKRLMESMKEYGFIPAFPIVCYRDSKGRLVVKDGQHRLMIAESLGLTVFWVEEAIDFNIATVNGTSRVWGIIDYAKMFSHKGLTAYTDAMEFSSKNELPLGIAVALLAGTTSWGNVKDDFISGKFKIKDLRWATAVAGIYVPMCGLSGEVRNARFLEACMAACRVDEFSPDRLLQSARRCRDKMVSFSTRDAYLTMLEEIYNFGRKQLFGLKAAATMTMRERNATAVSKRTKEAKASQGTAA